MARNLLVPDERHGEIGRCVRLRTPGLRRLLRGASPAPSPGLSHGGYLLSWTAFSVFATLGQWALERAALLTPEMASASRILGGLVLIAAGVFQWTPLKDACLKQCRAPLLFIQRHGGFRRDPLGALVLGFRHGLYCIGCCWALMGLLFVGGIMNVLCIAGIAIFVLAEKTVATGPWLSRMAGVGLAAGGIWLIGVPAA